MQGERIYHLAVGKLCPGLENGELSVVYLPQPVEPRLHAGRHAARVGSCERDGRIRVEDQFVGEAGRVSQNVVEDGSTDVRLGAVRVAVAQLEWDGDRLLGVVEIRLAQHCCW